MYHQQAAIIDRILERLRNPITDTDTATIPNTARDEVETILGVAGPLPLHAIITQNRADHRDGFAHAWSPEAIEAGLSGLLTDGVVTVSGFTFDPVGAAVGIFTVTPADAS